MWKVTVVCPGYYLGICPQILKKITETNQDKEWLKQNSNLICPTGSNFVWVSLYPDWSPWLSSVFAGRYQDNSLGRQPSIFKKWDVGVMSGLVWLRIGIGGGRLWVRWGTFGFHKTRGISWLAANSLASQEGTLLHGVSKYVSNMSYRQVS
jgi:hypothetical protein